MKKETILYSLFIMLCASCSAQKPMEEPEKEQPVLTEQLIFAQSEVGIGDMEGRMFIIETKPSKKWLMTSWQESPYIEGGKPFVPVDWDPVEKTGFSIPGDRALNQRGYRNEAGTTICQMFGGTVGAYLNSADLSVDGFDAEGNPLPGSGGYKQGIFPSYDFAPMSLSGSTVQPIYLWCEENSRVEMSVELQIPTAVCEEKTGSLAYAQPLLLLVDPKTNLMISWGPMLFSKRSQGDIQPLQSIKLDGPSNKLDGQR